MWTFTLRTSTLKHPVVLEPGLWSNTAACVCLCICGCVWKTQKERWGKLPRCVRIALPLLSKTKTETCSRCMKHNAESFKTYMSNKRVKLLFKFIFFYKLLTNKTAIIFFIAKTFWATDFCPFFCIYISVAYWVWGGWHLKINLHVGETAMTNR